MIDLSEVVRTDYGTGIHRVVRNLARELMAMPDDGAWTCLPVAHGQDGRMEMAWAYAHEKLGVEPGPDRQPREYSHGDRLFLADSAWEHPERSAGTITGLQAAGGQAGAMLYDLIPLRYPGYCVEYMPAIFERWLKYVLAHCDFIVCISRAVADDLRRWISEESPHIGRMLRIGHIHLGADVGEGKNGGAPSDAVQSAMGGGETVLMVGTVEPRKRHDLALSAFENLWRQGDQTRLVIVGKQGWQVDELGRRLKSHVESGRRLAWFEQASDADLDYCYRHCACLLQASDAEGFGLPIIEAGKHGKPLVLSDLAVFREIAGGNASYFTPGDEEQLVRALRPPYRPVGALQTITWEESACRLIRLLDGETWDHIVEASPCRNSNAPVVIADDQLNRAG